MNEAKNTAIMRCFYFEKVPKLAEKKVFILTF